MTCVRHTADGLAGERVLLAQAVGIAQAHPCRDLGSEFVPIVNGCTDHGAGPVLNSPPAFRRNSRSIHLRDSVWANVRLQRL